MSRTFRKISDEHILHTFQIMFNCINSCRFARPMKCLYRQSRVAFLVMLHILPEAAIYFPIRLKRVPLLYCTRYFIGGNNHERKEMLE